MKLIKREIRFETTKGTVIFSKYFGNEREGNIYYLDKGFENYNQLPEDEKEKIKKEMQDAKNE